jgi:hypothetical protein
MISRDFALGDILRALTGVQETSGGVIESQTVKNRDVLSVLDDVMNTL